MSGRGGAGVDVGSVPAGENPVVGGELRGRTGGRTDAQGDFVIWEEGQAGGWRPEVQTGEGLYLAGDRRRAAGYVLRAGSEHGVGTDRRRGQTTRASAGTGGGAAPTGAGARRATRGRMR